MIKKTIKSSKNTVTRHWLSGLAGLLALGCLLAAERCQAQVIPPSLVLSNKWSLASGSRWDLDVGNLTRGVAINKMTGNVLLASRVTTNHVSVISGVDGSDLGTLESTGISGGTLPLDLVRVADDGVIYAINLAATAAGFKIYRWNSEQDGMTNPPVLAFGPAAPGASTQRYGDSMDIRGGGTNTQIVVSGSGSIVYAVFTTIDGTNFTATEFTHGLGAGEFGKGITFEGTNNAIYGKNSGSLTLHKVAFDLTAGTSTSLANINLPTGDNNVVGTKYDSSNGVQFAVGVLTGNATAPHRFKAYTINNPASPSVSADMPFPSPVTANGNVIGSADVANGMAVGNDVNNGLAAFMIGFVTNLPPIIVSQPVDQTNVLAGGYVSFSVGASGTPPLSYQWKTNDVDLPGANSSTLILTNVLFSAAGKYSVAISNAYGFVLSTNVTLGVVPSVVSSAMVPLWSKSIGDLFFLVNDNTHRGLGYNPVTGHLIVVSRTPSNGVHVVDASTGAYIRSLDMSGIQPVGTFAISLSGVADDGAVYAANLDTGGANYTIYRWADESPSTVATIAFGPADPGVAQRIGDTFALRGAGVNTELLAATRNGTQIVLFKTLDGQFFTPNVIDAATEPAGLAGLGLAFGSGNTFWTKSSGYQFRHIIYDLANGTNGLLQTFAAGQNDTIAIGVDPTNDLIAATSIATPDNVHLYDVHAVVTGAAAEPTLIDQDFFKTDNENGNGTGTVAFDVAGGRIFALDTNNGLLASKVVARLFTQTTSGNTRFTWTGPSVLQSANSITGPWTTIAGASTGYATSMTASASFFRLAR